MTEHNLTPSQIACICDDAAATAEDLIALRDMGLINIGRVSWWLTVAGKETSDAIKALRKRGDAHQHQWIGHQ